MRQWKQREMRRHRTVGFADAGRAPHRGTQTPQAAEKSRKRILTWGLQEHNLANTWIVGLQTPRMQVCVALSH